MLNAALQELTTAFVQGLIGAIRNMPISEINGDGSHEAPTHAPRAHTAPVHARAPRTAAPTKAPKAKAAKSGRLARRTPEQVEEVIASVVALVRKHPDGLRAEDIRTALDLDVREVPRVLKQGIAEGHLKILSGQKRSTAYGVKGGKAKAAKPAARAASKKSAKQATAKGPKKAKAVKVAAAPKKKTKKVTRPAHAPKAAMNGAGAHAVAATA